MEQLKSNDFKILLAPMVRIGTLPFRLLCSNLGADLVFTEEIIDKKLMFCEKYYNKDLDTNDYVSTRDGSVVLRISVNIHLKFNYFYAAERKK